MKNINFSGKAKCFMIQGTTSSAGKSALTAGFLRYFSTQGYNSSPFKSQNMSLNSFVTDDGFEIAVSQAVQSEAAFKNPIRQINPILIKPSSDYNMHLIVEGKFHGNMDFNNYNKKKNYFLKKAKESFEFLVRNNDLVILEGAGSPAEINLFKFDIANMGFAELYGIPVILVADIERGGVFASIFGTVKLLPLKWRKLIKGFIINKFRGDLKILDPGIKSIESMLKIPCLGVLPHIKNLRLEAEDSLNLINHSGDMGSNNSAKSRKLRIGIVHLDHISNFNEFDPLFFDDRFDARFFKEAPAELNRTYDETPSVLRRQRPGSNQRTSSARALLFDMLIIPGTKSTISDILSMKKTGIFDYIKDFEKNGGVIMGICGGFQMMGKRIKDPFHIESEIDATDGFGFFDIETIIKNEKKVLNRRYLLDSKSGSHGKVIRGYEIHNGRTFFAEGYSGENIYTGLFKPAETQDNLSSAENGILSKDKKKIGTYIHGLFGNEIFKDFIVDIVEEQGGAVYNSNTEKGSRKLEADPYDMVKSRNYDLLSENIAKYIDIDMIKNFIGI
ncbi:MAG: cobyric acid synthase [Deltaproteobacteria bacterium]|jgi:adenosylcobyric acid synthase|nr:cobyric acid synthase [Deltaproteobacteria bacterium]MCL5880807.1 cobyric acid synthase [Deltaproteobacteria bacterium]MDA8304273.1 cobyric acid synthase [Deltaproteobacteria bacterium]